MIPNSTPPEQFDNADAQVKASSAGASVQVYSQKSAQYVMSSLLDEDCGYQVTPMPGRQYEISVEPDGADLLRDIVSHFRIAADEDAAELAEDLADKAAQVEQVVW